jgi:hypothetical protein
MKTLFNQPNKHDEHKMHSNSLEAWKVLKTTERRKKVIEVYEKYGEKTDREVCKLLGFTEMNRVRPRITELLDTGVLVEVGRVKCKTTGIRVRVCDLSSNRKKVIE